jgi:hypothetical protein
VYDYTPAGTSLRRLGREGAYVLARAPEGWDHGAALALAMQMYLMPESAGRWDLSAAFELDYRGLFPTYQSALTHAVRALEGTPAHLRLLQIGGVSHLVALHEQGFSALQPDVTLPGLFADPIRVFRVPAPRPRAYAVSRARPAGDTEALEILLDPLFDPEREIVVAVPPRDVRADPTSAAPAPPPGVARISDERADRVTVRAELDRPGYVVLLDAYDPGWRATIDGEPAELLRANLAFRAVSVPPGAHTVQFLYRPPALLAGLGLSAAALLGVAVGSVRRGPG